VAAKTHLGDLTVETDAGTAATHRLAAALDALGEAAGSGIDALEAHGKALLAQADPANAARNAIAGVSSELKGLGTAGAAASVALVGALGAIAVGGIKLALDVHAFNEQLVATFDALGKGPDAGARTVEMLDDVARELPQSREQLAGWTREIEKMGVTDLGQVRGQLLATASAQGILGEEGAGAYQRIARKAQDAIEGNHKLTIASKELTKTLGINLTGAVAERMGLSLEKLEVQLKTGTVDAAKFGSALEETLIAKGGKGLDAMWSRSDVIFRKLKDAGGELFSGVDASPVTGALLDVLGLFDQTKPEGLAMKAVLTDAFGAVASQLGLLITQTEIWGLEIATFALRTQKALNPLGKALDALGNALSTTKYYDPSSGKEITKSQHDAGYEEFKRAEGFDPSKATPTLGIETKRDPGEAVGWDPSKPVKKIGFDAEPAAQASGRAIGDGLVNGLLATVPAVDVAGAVVGAVAVKGARTGAGVRSPSKPAIEIGGYISEGLGLGMVQSPAPARAGRQIGGYALGGIVGQALAAPPANANGGGGGVTIGTVRIEIMAPQGVTDATAISASGLAVALERFQLASGR
jgi:hypothetical protein